MWAGKCQWDDRPGGDADKDVQGEAITKYCWSEGKNTVSIYLELDGLDDVTDDAFKVESGKTNVSLTIASVGGKQRIFKLTGLAHEITGVKVAQKKGKQKLAKKEEKTWRKLLDDASTKEAGADDTASSNTDITSCVSQTILSDFSKNLEGPSPTENEKEIDDQRSSMDSHEIQCEKEYWSDLRADTGSLFLPGKIVMEQHNLTHFPSQPWSKEAKSSRFEESAGELTNDRDPAKMPEMWIANTNPGSPSTVMELTSATPVNESKFSSEETTVTTSSLNTMGTKRKHKSAYDDRMQVDSLKKGDPGSWMSENGNELQTAQPTRAGVSDEVAQEFQVIPNVKAHINGPQVNFQNEISDPDEYAKATNATAMREAEKTDFSLKTKHEKRSRVANPTPPDPGLSLRADPLVTLPDRSCMGDPTYELNRPQHYVFDRGLTWKQKVYELEKCMDDLLQLIRLCPLRDTEHSMSMKRHTTEQNMTTVEDGHNTADDGETHEENRREIQIRQLSKLIDLLEAEHILQIRDSSGHEEQHSRFFHETP